MATIIKPHASPRGSGAPFRGVAYDLSDMAEQADEYLRSVEREAAKIVEQARREAVAIRQDAEAAGRRAAEQAIDRILDEKVARQMKTLIPALETAVKQIQDAKQDWLRHWETAALDLAAAIAGRLIRSELTSRPEIAVEWIRQSLELAAGCAELAIHLHPADEQTLRRQVEQLAAAMCPLATVTVVADDSISAAGCRIVTEFGAIDGQLETQLERLKEEIA